jgi:hypothetical protein
MTAYHHSVYCDLIHNEDATNKKNLSEMYLVIRRSGWDVITELVFVFMERALTLFWSDFSEIWIFFDRFSKNTQM